jgi:hypothetical protein
MSQQTRNKSIQAQKGTDAEFGRYAGKHEGHIGHLILTDVGARFETTVRSDVHWDLPYGLILRMEKVLIINRSFNSLVLR